MSAVTIYVEGGEGGNNTTTKAALRNGMNQFLGRLKNATPAPTMTLFFPFGMNLPFSLQSLIDDRRSSPSTGVHERTPETRNRVPTYCSPFSIERSEPGKAGLLLSSAISGASPSESAPSDLWSIA